MSERVGRTLSHCLGWRIDRIKRERERRGVGLGGRHLAEQCNNQKIADVSGGGSDGGEMRPGQNVWDDAMSSFRSLN